MVAHPFLSGHLMLMALGVGYQLGTILASFNVFNTPVQLFLLPLIECLLLIAIYRSAFHPLAKYPGPCWAALTDWYTVYHILQGDRHIDFYRLHERYGKIVRFGPRRMSIRSTAALKDIYNVSANVKRSEVYASTAHYFGGTASSNTTSDMKEHAFRRRVNVRALNPTGIKGMEEKILQNIRVFNKMLETKGDVDWSTAYDMSKVIGCLVSDIMGDITFSKSWNVQQSEENRDLLRKLPQAVAGIHLVGYMPELTRLKLDKILFASIFSSINRFTELSASILQWRFSQPPDSCNDLFAALLRSKDTETSQSYSPAQLVSEAGLLTIAGSDTTITATTAAFFYLLHYRLALKKLQNEVRTAFNTVEDIRIGPKLQGCVWLFACIDETLRITPPVGTTLMREVLPGGLAIEEEKLWFPQGTDVGVPHYALHHDSTYFFEPFTFKPERWLSENASDPQSSSARTPADAFTAFGVGRTSCIGKYLAYQEIALVLARTLWLFDIRLKPGSTLGEGRKGLGTGRERKREFQTRDQFVSVHEGPEVQFKRRI